MKYNSIIEKEIEGLLVASPGDEYVVLNDLKRELNLVFTTSGSYEFTDDDTLLQDIIDQARSVIEEYTGLGLTPMNVAVILRNECGGIELPFGPFVSLTSIKDADGNTITSYTLRGNRFKRLEDPLLDYIEVKYATGYNKATEDGLTPTFPEGLKKAWLAQAVWIYNHRGEEKDMDICTAAMNYAAPYVRKSFLA
jgi:hypothetical protein